MTMYSQKMSSHLFFTDSGWWKSAKNITVGDRILTSDGELKEVTAIRVVELEEAVRIYNLNVEDYHTYFVGVSGLLVHNDCTAEMMYAGREAIENARRINIDDPKILSQIGEVAAKMVDDVKVMKKYIIVPENGFQAFVERKYIEIRKVALNDVADVAHNTGLPIQDIIDMKNHLFLNTHKISVDGKPLETLYFQGDADIAYGWQVAQTRKLTDAEKEWFIQLRNHELLEKNIWMKECP